MDNENEPRQTSWLAFRDALDGPPTYWVPPGVSTSPIPSSSKNEPPTSLWKGEGQVQLDAVLLWLLGALVIGPISLQRAEGPFSDGGA